MPDVSIMIDGQAVMVPDTDPKAIADVVDPAAVLAEARANMVAERHHFAKACARAGIIPSSDALIWGPGNALPAAVDAALDAAISDPVALSEAQVDALSATKIRRTHPLILLLQGPSAFDLTDAQVDDLFVVAVSLEQAV